VGGTGGRTEGNDDKVAVDAHTILREVLKIGVSEKAREVEK